jgi:hypothetical protein
MEAMPSRWKNQRLVKWKVVYWPVYHLPTKKYYGSRELLPSMSRH